MPAKYYIYASGRWCEVETRRGRVEGSRQRARFCFLRGGRLEVARTAPVLRALRALAIGSGGAARDAAPLPRSRPSKWQKERAAGHVCCSQHPHNSRCDLNANELAEKPPLQTVTLSIASSPRKRKRSSTEDARIQGKSEASKTKDRLAEGKRVRGIAEQRIVQSLLQSSSEDTVKGSSQSKKTKSSPKKLTNKSQELKGSDTQVQNQSSSHGTKPTQSPLNTHKQSRADGSMNDVGKKSQQKSKKIRSAEEEKLVQSLLQTSSSEEVVELAPKRPQTARRSKPQLDPDPSSDEEARKPGPCKELIIEDTVVAIMRNYLAENVGWDAVERFDSDDAYKTRLFYKLNPLVALRRYPPMEQLLKQRLTLKEFAQHLGLRSVADVTPEKRYRMRHSTRQARQEATDSETDKENVVQPKRRQLWNRDKVAFNSFRSSRSSDVRHKPQIPKPSRDTSSDNVDSDAEIKKHIRRHLERRASGRLNPERKETQTKNDDKSVVVSDDDSISNTDENERNSRITKAKTADKPNESVVVSDESDDNRKTRRTRATNKAEHENESVLVSDSDDNKKSSKKTRVTSDGDNNESLIVSDDSDGNNNAGGSKSARKTRSQGPEKRVLRERNKSVVISDDSDGKTDGNRDSSSKSKHGKTVAVSDESNSNTSEDQSKSRSRTDRELKDRSGLKKNYDKNKKRIDSSESIRKTRSSIKGADKTENKGQGSKNETTSKSEVKHGLNKDVKDSNKAEIAKEQDKSRKGADDDASEESPMKSTQRTSFGDLIRNCKGRFLKRSKNNKKQQNTDKKVTRHNDSQVSGDENDATNRDYKKTDKSSQGHRKVTGNDITNKINEKHRVGNRNNETRGQNGEEDERTQQNDGSRKERTEYKTKDNIEKPASAKMLLEPVKFKKSSVANGREYTSLEDHAIVAWVSAGRERMVNGNAIWRELQQQYTRLTSQTRSWHSLRNRYLRYILPSLASLSLPQSQVSRLRAAAATGKIKCRGRRNSIYNVPKVISASAAGRRKPQWSDSENDERKERRPSPARARLASPSSLAPSPSKATPPKRSLLSPSKHSSPKKPTPAKRVLSLKNSPRRHNLSLSKRSAPPSSPRTVSPPSEVSPPKPGPRARSSVTSSPAPVKKKRIHCL